MPFCEGLVLEEPRENEPKGVGGGGAFLAYNASPTETAAIFDQREKIVLLIDGANLFAASKALGFESILARCSRLFANAPIYYGRNTMER